MFEPRPYQQECLDAIHAKPPGRYLVQMATGLGKTAVFTHINHDRMLILSHREELVRQPLKWFDCTTGIEQGKYRSNHMEKVVSACVPSIVRRLHNYEPEEFDLVIVDECHHAGANSYKKVLNHFKPEKCIGFTATPNRSDGVRLNDVFSEIIFQRDLEWAIRNNWLCGIHCLRVEIGYDLSAVSVRNGDYAPGELDEAMDGTADAIAEAYRDHAKGATIIFAVSVHQCEEIAARIPGAVVVTGETKDRQDIIDRFTRREIPCIVNCMVFTEGTDIPLIETVIIARPTTSEPLYTQMVGRGLRKHPEKDKLTLIDCVGIAGKLNLCTAPSLLGIDLDAVPQSKRQDMQGDLFHLPKKAVALSDTPESWIKNVQVVDLFAKKQGYNLHNVQWFIHPDGHMTVCADKGVTFRLPAVDRLGMIDGHPAQEVFDAVYQRLSTNYKQSSSLWDRQAIKRWGSAPASEKQKALIGRMCKGFDPSTLTKEQASLILNRRLNK